ncbi:uncharacterized protein L201_003559 [Kwoniella dendrophila CBS 6074]|uniref:TPR-like protein n=1 Tax=Kwoniella dendrophila CBS 6074 TaxID=1295534 RepID=A0AAX4JTA5_9TREE
MASITRNLLSATARATSVSARSIRTGGPLIRQRIIAGPSSSTFSIRRGYATSSGESSSIDPSLTKALDLIELGTKHLEEGDLNKAAKYYKESIELKETSEGWYNLGNCEYHLQNKVKAVESWGKSIELKPSADAHTNLASAYILDSSPKPALAIKHLTAALELSPEDPEIAFNLAAVLESTNQLEPALTLYKKAQSGGIERAAQNVRNVSAKIIGQRAKSQEEESK